MAMNSKHKQPFTVFGQRSLASSLRSLPSCKDSKNASGKERVSKKPISASLSDFLHHKLPKTSAQLGTVEAKSTPFLSPLGSSRVSVDGNIASKKQSEGERTGTVSEKMALDRFRHVDEGSGDFFGSRDVVEEENSNTGDVLLEELRRVGNPFQVEEESSSRRKQVVVLGGNSQLRQKRTDVKFTADNFENGGNESNITRRNINVLGCLSQLKRKRRQEGFYGSKKPKSSFNHYENGSGWWDSDMEGVDNEEVGFNEVWEGVGSTTLGGIEWH